MPALQLLRNDRMRSFRIDIETDSTIAVDETADKQAATEFLTAMGNYMASSLPMAQQAPELLPVIGQGAVFLARRFRAGRQLEGSIEASFQALEQRAAQLAQKQPQDPAAQQQAAEAQADAQKQAMETQKSDRDFALKQRELDLKEREASFNEALQIQQLKDAGAARAEARQDALLPDREAVVQGNEGALTQLAAALAALGQSLEMMQQQQTNTAQVQMQALAQLSASMAAPKRVVRGPDGRAMGVETVMN